MKLLKNSYFCLIAIIGFALILRIAAISFLDIEPRSDARSYMEMATTMLSSGHMNDGMGNVAYYSSGYPLFLIPFFALFGASAETAQAVNLVLGIATVYLVYLCATAILPNGRWALIPTLIWATYPPALLYTEYILKENLVIPLLLLQTYLLIKYTESQHKNLVGLAIGFIFGFGLLVAPAILFTGACVAIVVTGIFGGGWPPTKFNWRPAFICFFGCALALTPWLSYTTTKLGKPVLATNGGFNLYLGNNPNATGYFVSIMDTPAASRWHSALKNDGEIAATSMLKDMALKHIWENPGKTISLSLKKVVYFWMPPIHEGEHDNQSQLETMMRLVWLIYYGLVIGFAMVPLYRFRELGRGEVIIFSTVILYCAIHAAAYVIYRYRLPVMPLMSVLAAVGMHYVYLWSTSARSRLLLRRS
jgi:hypothetical protein